MPNNIFSKRKLNVNHCFYAEGSGHLTFQDFCALAGRFMMEEEDDEAMQQQLREAFRLYDREGN